MFVIVDLQDYYIPDLAAREPEWSLLLGNLKSRISTAKKRREPIVSLNSTHEGCTIPEVLEMLKGYPHRINALKDDFDGALELVDIIEHHNLYEEPIELCGIFRDVCVLETWKHLKDLGFNVLPIQRNLSLPTLDNWRRIAKYPEGFEENSTGCLDKDGYLPQD